MSDIGRRARPFDDLASLIGAFLDEAPVIDEIATRIERHPLAHQAALREGLRLLEAAGGAGLTLADWVAALKERGHVERAMPSVRCLIEEFGCCVTRRTGLTFVYTPNATPSLDEFDLGVDEVAADDQQHLGRVRRALRAMNDRTTFQRNDLLSWLVSDGLSQPAAEAMADDLIRTFWAGSFDGTHYRPDREVRVTNEDTMLGFRQLLHPGR